ncbi:DNA polymerase III subunit epsilon [Candidatus Palibaumannia cicadellinicola]|uniref:DNA polymerase III subunit epsilon n=1 Tax=Baumannia cicadellinicola subsp. Homalodisca coagulata TaxID=374463 RepID=Q1LT03_BAUCH|nr:DNA polymerase III subunit epsilon [Candidatus Baumannia cicadellinicola]ABF13891.1 DNA polymerase III, epsilon subunit [Baumannia cicadellinicola str. Hc (Homalodisca coagulata)]MBS0032772.1 DNA polymerase III subunit epsilon [Candidatus Baumannia cicadellinicola]MCJ7462051.1 DNA polymerase III subunit epsilon [Candidatus Baumannia cicadellinicola]MCJ7463078.1 DNA polymerase III subunit epsilon [Candidatus Baumannia cicadellinicola]
MKRQIVLDIETTGINKLGVHYYGHRIIEIGAVEIINRRITGKNFHVYLNPERFIDQEAFKIHGISNNFLKDKPTFAQVADKLITFISQSELVIHHAPFDIGFIDYEFKLLNRSMISKTFVQVTDTLLLARKIFPGKRNSLDALCNRYHIKNIHRTKHGALLDAKILAEIYLIMTGGQTSINFNLTQESNIEQKYKGKNIYFPLSHEDKLKVIYANNKELSEHRNILDRIEKQNSKCLWKL